MSSDDKTPLIRGLRLLGERDARYALTHAQIHAVPRDGGALISRTATSAWRAKPAVESLASAMKRVGGSLDQTMLDLSPHILPEGRRVESPTWVRQYTANMEIKMTSVALAGVAVDNIGGLLIPPTGPPLSVNYPIELPNVQTMHIHTAVGVPAGSGPERGYWKPSDRDPRQALKEVTVGGEALATARATRFVVTYATLPLKASGNSQRNYYNAALRAWCVSNKRPLLDVAHILSEGSSGRVARDQEGPRLADEWRGSDESGAYTDDACLRVAQAWWKMQSGIVTASR